MRLTVTLRAPDREAFKLTCSVVPNCSFSAPPPVWLSLPVTVRLACGATAPLLFVTELAMVPSPSSVDPDWTSTEVALSKPALPPMFVVAPVARVYGESGYR